MRVRTCARRFHVTSPSTDTALDYDPLRDALAQAGAVIALSELHGGVCAALCAGGPIAGARWLVRSLADEELRDATALEAPLRNVLDVSWRMLAGDELAFMPLLPDDDAPLDDQVQALALWCHGFLGGLGATAPDARELRPNDGGAAAESAAAEILADFAEISRAGLSEDEAAGLGRPDFSLAELVEYVRVGVQLVYEELAPHRSQRSAEH
jgi:uncharacterized protein YgfB (UPF0149 family)